jgi:cell division protein FtsI/penicillin-binding protein 2
MQRELSTTSELDRNRLGVRRVRALAGITLAAFIIVTGQLWHLQVLEGPRLSELSDRNRVRVRPLAAPRGTLYDRHDVPRAGSSSCWTSFSAAAMAASTWKSTRRGAWFAGYAPADDPEMVVVVLVEHGGMGGRVAAPIAREIFREIFRPAGVERPA